MYSRPQLVAWACDEVLTNKPNVRLLVRFKLSYLCNVLYSQPLPGCLSMWWSAGRGARAKLAPLFFCPISGGSPHLEVGGNYTCYAHSRTGNGEQGSSTWQQLPDISAVGTTQTRHTRTNLLKGQLKDERYILNEVIMKNLKISELWIGILLF